MFQIIDNYRGKRTCLIQGDMDAYGVLESGLNNVLERLADNWDGDVDLDFSEVTFMDSSGIGAIVYLYKRIKASDRKLEIVGVNGQPREIMRNLRIDRTIPISETVPSDASSQTQQAIAPGV